MYKKYTSHALICGDSGIVFDKLNIKYDYSLVQLPMISGGFYSKLTGTKWCELTAQGVISIDDIHHYNSFFAAVRDRVVNMTVDTTEYRNCVLVETEITALPDSRLRQFTFRFRSVGNG